MGKGIRQYQEGERTDLFLMIKSTKKGVTGNGKPFLTLILQDQSGDIEGKLWDCSDADEKMYVAEKMVHLTGDITSFRGQNQLRIQSIRLATAQDGVKISDFLQSAPLSVEEMGDRITAYIFGMENPHIQRITRHLVKKHQEAFFTYPAATRNHHEFLSGLAYHVVSMLDLAKAVSKIYPSLHTDLLYAGVILHDLGKIEELSGVITAEYTVKGKLLGHISIMAGKIEAAARELGIEGEEVTLLVHMVLSHHGKGEWGSPKPPLLREAEVLHMLDNLDAKINMIDRVLERTPPGSFTERLQPMEYRTFYHPKFPSKEK